jgi:hypothetical protein
MSPSSREVSPLGVLGFTFAQQDLYRVILRSSGATLDSVADLVGTSVAALKEDLARFVATGLVDFDAETGVVSAAPPDQALGRLISDESQRLQSVGQQLDSLRNMLPSLMADHLASQAPKGEPVAVEVVEGDVVGLIRSLTASSSGDLMWLRPDQWQLPFIGEIDSWVKDLIQSGRRSRAIYPARILEDAPEVIRSRAEAGEHVRLLASVPVRVAIMGRGAALIPEDWGGNPDRRLVVRQESLVAALRLLFENMWDRAMTVPGLEGGVHEGGRGGDRRLLLDQLAGGAKDEQIARAMGLSLRTVRRRVADIMDDLGVQSRFQAGVEAVRRGWI